MWEHMDFNNVILSFHFSLRNFYFELYFGYKPQAPNKIKEGFKNKSIVSK